MDSAPDTPLKEWIAALRRADADMSADRVVDGATIIDELRASIERIERRTVPKRAFREA